MKKLLLLFLLIPVIGLSQNEPYQAYYDNGQLKVSGQYIDGNQEGIWKYYHENGQLSSEGNYKNDKSEGKWIGYWDNGNTRNILYHKDGKYNGDLSRFDRYGNDLYKTRFRNGTGY